MASLTDVANLAGVSKGTVSRVLNNKGYLSQETREKVYSAVKALNYRTDMAALSKLGTKFSTIGLLVPDICYPHFSNLALCIESELSKRGYRMILCNTLNSARLGIDNLEIFQHGPIDGLILCDRTVSDEELESLRQPIVSVDRYAHSGISTVSSDHPVSGETAANLLIACGCKHVLQTVGSGAPGSPWNERHTIFEKTMKAHGVECRTHFRDVLRISDIAFNRQQIREQMALYPEVDGYFANDICCIAAIEEAKALGRRIPEDFQVISCDGTYLSEVFTPHITTIRQPVERIAVWAVDTICRLIEDPTIESCDVQLKSTLIEREPTRRRG